MQVTKDKLQNAKLSPREIPGIRLRVRSGTTTTAQEADRFGVGVETIRRAVRGETFRNVEAGIPPDERPAISLPLIQSETVLDSARRLKGLLDEPEGSPVDLFLEERTKQVKEDK